MAINSYDVQCEKKKCKKHDPKSPYLTTDRVQLLSRVTEKRFIQKKTMDYVSSFPLAVNIYKANSDEFKSLKRAKKKIKKSVLTLPNNPSPMPQICTVSDMNDSEYYSQNTDNQGPRIKKRSAIKNVRKSRAKNKDYEFFDREAGLCSQFNLENSSADLIKGYKGDSKRLSKRQKGYKESNSSQKHKENEGDVKPHDVWAILRNMKRFQFKSSPPASEDSVLSPKKKKKKKKVTKKLVNCKDTRVFETVRQTEEIAYISSFKVDNSSASLSQTSSFDRITVIDKKDKFHKICKDFEARFLKTGLNDMGKNNNQIESNNKIQRRPNNVQETSIGSTVKKEHATELSPLICNDIGGISLKIKNGYTNYKAKTTVDESSLIKSDDLHKMDYSEVTSVCSNTKYNEEIEPNVECSDLVQKFYIYSDNSGSSKAEISADTETSKIKGKLLNGHVPQLKGISRVIFGNKCKPINQTPPRRVEDQKRKSRFVTTIPSGCAMPKLTKTEIKRRLAIMKFPVVLLGKDQVNPIVQVQNYEYPQFDGLDKQIWPFMAGWDEKNQLKSEADNIIKHYIESRDNNGHAHRKLSNVYPDCNLNNLRKINNDVAINKRPNYKPKKIINGDLTNKNKSDLQRQVTSTEMNNKVQLSSKQEAMNNIKDKMLNLLYKKLPDKKIVGDDNYNKPKENTIELGKKVDASTEIQTKAIVSPVRLKAQGSPIKTQNKKPQRNVQHRSHPWAKAKWASDFIENVIKKIKCGVYYSQGVTEISIQTEPSSDQSEVDFSPKVTIKKKQNVPKPIPGFESPISGLEIKTLNMNQISIKHCIANVLMHFDVAVPGETKPLLMSPKASIISLIPLEGTESHSKVFKCKTSLLNAMLPAELCSIIPKMVNLFDSEVTSALRPTVCSGLLLKKESHLTTISETTPVETASTTTSPSSISIQSSMDHLPPVVKNMLGGMFSNAYNLTKDHVTNKIIPLVYYDVAIQLLPKIIVKDSDILTYRIRSFIPAFLDPMISNNKTTTRLPDFSQKQSLNCTALELYQSKNKRLALPFQPYDFITNVRDILMRHKLCIINVYVIPNITFTMQQNCNLLNVQILDYTNSDKKLHLSASNLRLDSQSCEHNNDKRLILRNTSSQKRVEFIKRSANYTHENKDQHYSEIELKTTNNKVKLRKGFYRLYRKCKSTTNIPSSEKFINTPLNKILTLEDFFQIIGSKKLMSSIFDGYAERKILSSIEEMKQWITDINPRQALLILLLTNKKDTPNLVRFRPVLLQGIAVNRITRATELDMEIEVIERENLNKLQYEGISYLPGSTENHDQLLEELYWIAKTTASDYQKPFDESSERLLRSLLEKRKKLNPSYLRVMARYVGLGLLKSPTKK